ncbi:hypothetical protein CKO51_27260 [Rhodopirellula sp. SM50]|nr:hypothetical protein CKO51_27260 [Rhodopirellula sp. SM50]
MDKIFGPSFSNSPIYQRGTITVIGARSRWNFIVDAKSISSPAVSTVPSAKFTDRFKQMMEKFLSGTN